MRLYWLGFLLTVCIGFLAVFLVVLAHSADGKALYEAKCMGCHGPTGTGNEKLAAMMKTDPSLFNITNSKKTDAELKKLFQNGQGKMPIIKDLSPADTDALIKYSKTLRK